MKTIRGETRFLLAAPLLLLAACRASDEKTGFVVLPGMVEPVPVETYERTAASPTGAALLRPPFGTVPVEGAVFAYGPGPVEAARAGRELSNPFPASEGNLARGKFVFETYCAVCHGATGQGDGPIIGGANRFPNPPSLTANRAKGLPDGQLFHVATRGQGIMPAHAAQVRPEDRWKAVLFVRSLQFPGGVRPAGSAAPAPVASPAPSDSASGPAGRGASEASSPRIGGAR